MVNHDACIKRESRDWSSEDARATSGTALRTAYALPAPAVDHRNRDLSRVRSMKLLRVRGLGLEIIPGTWTAGGNQ